MQDYRNTSITQLLFMEISNKIFNAINTGNESDFLDGLKQLYSRINQLEGQQASDDGMEIPADVKLDFRHLGSAGKLIYQ